MIGGYAQFSNTKRLKKLPFFAFFYHNEDHMEPACREALELARREADDPSWIDGFFQRAQGDCLICWYARWHPESGLSIPTREQWDDFLEELKSKGVDY